MQNPKQSETPANTFRHEFTVPQLELVNVYLSQLNAAEQKSTSVKQNIGLFMNFLQREYNMTPGVVWSLSQGPDGKPFMSGVLKAT